MQQAAKDDILHFQELLEAIKVTFPSADYAGTWLDLHGLLTLLRLSHMNGEDKQTGWAKGRPQGLCRFFAGVEHEVEKVKKCVQCPPHTTQHTCVPTSPDTFV